MPRPDVRFHRLGEDRVHAGGRLVEQHEPRFAHQHRGELEQLPLTPRQLRGEQVGDGRESELLEEIGGSPAVSGRDAPTEQCRPTRAGGNDEVLLHGQLEEHPRLLERARQAATGETPGSIPVTSRPANVTTPRSPGE